MCEFPARSPLDSDCRDPRWCLRTRRRTGMSPAVYVLFAVIGVVATGCTIKEVRSYLLVSTLASQRLIPGVSFHQFIYDPHIAPMIRDWKERRKGDHNSQRQMHHPILAVPEHRSQRSPTQNPPPIELDTVVAGKVDEWKTSTNMRRMQTGDALMMYVLPPMLVHSRLTFLQRIPYEVDYPLLSPSTPELPVGINLEGQTCSRRDGWGSLALFDCGSTSRTNSPSISEFLRGSRGGACGWRFVG